MKLSRLFTAALLSLGLAANGCVDAGSERTEKATQAEQANEEAVAFFQYAGEYIEDCRARMGRVCFMKIQHHGVAGPVDCEKVNHLLKNNCQDSDSPNPGQDATL